MTLIGLAKFVWGLVKDKPVLPPGYVYIERHREWLLAEAPNGRRYYVSVEDSGVLYRQGVQAKTRMYCVDCRETIILPQKQLAWNGSRIIEHRGGWREVTIET